MVEEGERAATEKTGWTADTKKTALTRSGAPTRRFEDCGRATGGFLHQAGVQGKMGGGGCCQTAGKF